MTDFVQSASSLLFYPTSPVHIANLKLIADKLLGWKVVCVVSENSLRFSPAIADALIRFKFEQIVVRKGSNLSDLLPDDWTVVMLGAAFEPFSLELFTWAKARALPVVAVEEVSQLSLNNGELNNYDLPLDLLFVANELEYRLLCKTGWPAEALAVSGLLSWERFGARKNRDEIRQQLGITKGKPLLVYTTSPLRSRLTIHNRDDRNFRNSILGVLAQLCAKGVWKIIVKLHPNENLEEERELSRRISPDIMVCGPECDTIDLLEAADIVMNRGNSETILDALILGRPVLVLACGMTTLFHELGGVTLLENPGDLLAVVADFETAAAPAFPYMEDIYALPRCGVVDFIASELQNFIGEKRPLTLRSLEWLVKSHLFLGMMNKLPGIFQLWHERTPLLESIESAVTCHLANDFNGSAIHWKAAAELDPAWFYPHYELAHAFLAIQNWESALEHVHSAVTLHPPFHYLWHEIPLQIVKTTVLRNMNMPQEALREAIEYDSRGVSELVPELLIERATIQTALGNSDEANTLLHKSLKLLESFPLWPEVDSQFYHRAGLIFRDINELDQALCCFKSVLDLTPESFWPRYELACIYITLHEYERAGEFLPGIVDNSLLDEIQRCHMREMVKELSSCKARFYKIFNFIKTIAGKIM
jgi:tetratricopeptide (TPR) repeat protein